MITNEIWKQVDGYSNYYVSNKGNVASVYLQAIKRNSKDKGFVVKMIKPSIVAGYYCVSLSNNEGAKLFKIHRLVAKAFVKNKRGLEQVNHKDENKLNNNADNLEWCDSRYNNNYGNRMKKVKVKLSMPVGCYDKNGNKIKEYKSLQSVKADGFNPSKVCAVCKHKYGRNTHKGYIWNYINA